MTEKNWNECLDSGNVIKINPDKEKAKSLLEIAEERINQLIAEVNEKNVNFVFEDYYSSSIEVIHAIVLVNGYNTRWKIRTEQVIQNGEEPDSIVVMFSPAGPLYLYNSL